MLWSKFREKNSGFAAIVPCNEGEEKYSVKEDGFRRDHVGIAEDIPINVLSALAPNVANTPLYWFMDLGRKRRWIAPNFYG